ncbi:hypothetical protein AVEN_228317-1 [Araneus ventricosus]|uniref:Uncharacterized protein n=1 Tax=Araneus ventricosus TaxID=182803 RepID=A0A4Y2T5U8_ARAVE|nr:hypothetical protein AVEN_228317-1 [Araneus ventricosus]
MSHLVVNFSSAAFSSILMARNPYEIRGENGDRSEVFFSLYFRTNGIHLRLLANRQEFFELLPLLCLDFSNYLSHFQRQVPSVAFSFILTARNPFEIRGGKDERSGVFFSLYFQTNGIHLRLLSNRQEFFEITSSLLGFSNYLDFNDRSHQLHSLSSSRLETLLKLGGNGERSEVFFFLVFSDKRNPPSPSV